MPVTLQCANFVLSPTVVDLLWEKTRQQRNFPDESVTVQCVGEDEIRALNKQYRQQDTPTNVLTFSYDHSSRWPAVAEGAGATQHDVALCLAVAGAEASARQQTLPTYVALLLVHGFLHVTGLDHEQGEDEAERMSDLEQQILMEAGLPNLSL